jgi:GDP-L-fucose synthase
MKEEHLLTGVLEPTNEPYAIAKITGIKMCEAYRDQYGDNFISCMPTNLYGPNDNYDLQNSHVLPALIRKFHEAKLAGAKSVEIWGDGSPQREFMHVDDLAEACIFLMETYDEKEFVNVGVGTDISIKALASMIQRIVGFTGTLHFDTSKPTGTPRKLMDVSRLTAAGFQAQISLEQGITQVYQDFQENYDKYVSGSRVIA